jgi:hypothetical protein
MTLTTRADWPKKDKELMLPFLLFIMALAWHCIDNSKKLP